MVVVATEYVGPSVMESSGESAALSMSTNERRPVRFHARVEKHVLSLRRALRTLGELVWSDFQWLDENEWERQMELILDPVITVHPDRVFFEAFNQDQSAYGLVIADREIFDADGEVCCGTTNIDFTRGLWSSLGEMRSSRETWFRVGPSGFGVSTGSEGEHFEQKVELPTEWVRGFLQLQAAMSLPGTRVIANAVDVASIIRFVEKNKAYESPRSLRFEFVPGKEVDVVLEPWEERMTLRGAKHRYREAKTTRIWGRRRLSLIEPLLSFATGVEIYLKGRALPSFWAVQLPGVVFVLGMSGWTGNNWTQAASFDLMAHDKVEEEVVDRCVEALKGRFVASVDELCGETGFSTQQVSRALSEGCRRGLLIYDVRDRKYRHRELFEEPIDVEEYFPPDPRKERSLELLDAGEVRIIGDEIRQTAGSTAGRDGGVQTFEDRVIHGESEGHEVEVVLRSDGRIIFGRCTCDFFDENLMNKGPCEHMLAARKYADELDETTETEGGAAVD